MPDPDPPREFPVFEPQGVKWQWPIKEPIVGPEAKADLLRIKEQDTNLARRLGRDVAGLLLNHLSKRNELVPDEPERPRYLVDLREGYCAVFWVLAPPSQTPGVGNAIWIERVVLRRELDDAFEVLAPEEPGGEE